MKKYLVLCLMTGLLSILMSATAFAGVTVKINTEQTEKGIVVVELSGVKNEVIKAQVIMGDKKEVYSLKHTTVNLPLQFGAGEYKVQVLQQVSGNQYMSLASTSFKVKTIDETALYTASIPHIDYAVSTTAVPAYQKLADSDKKDKDKINTVYDSIVKGMTYDKDKAAAVAGTSGYVPVLDDVYKAKKGICYDYAAVLGGSLRSMEIPTRLVMGYRPGINEYHAWNEILIDDKWVMVDATYDSALANAGRKYTLGTIDASKVTILHIY